MSKNVHSVEPETYLQLCSSRQIFTSCKIDYPGLYRFRESFADAYGIIGLTICSISVISNVINLTILSKKWLRRPTSTILVGIAAMDLCVSMSQMPMLIRYYLTTLIESNFKNETVAYNYSSAASILSEYPMDLSFDHELACPATSNIVHKTDFHWLCMHEDYTSVSWMMAVFFLFAYATALSSHTCSVWFGAILGVFRWCLIRKLNRRLTKMRIAASAPRPFLDQKENDHTLGIVATPADLHVTRVCIQCGQAFSITPARSTSNEKPNITEVIRPSPCDCILSHQSEISHGFCSETQHRFSTLCTPRHMTQPSLNFSAHESPSIIRLRKFTKVAITDHSRSSCDTCFSKLRNCAFHKSQSPVCGKENIGRLLWSIVLTVNIFLIPYYITLQTKATYQLIQYAPEKLLINGKTKPDNFCVDNQIYVKAILVGYRPTRNEEFIFESYSFWIVAGMGKLLPCCLILAFGVRLLLHLRSNISNRLALVSSLQKTTNTTTHSKTNSHVSQSVRKRLQNHRRTSRLLILVILLCLPVELPTALILILKRYTYVGDCLLLCLGDLLDCMALLKNCLTFVLYCVMSSEFRAAFVDSLKIFGLQKRTMIRSSRHHTRDVT
ncbi:hypothetical protein PHET_02515 [Paragonimus heterotremus]|uniref:G-protein coupled receptors family 1 profile domain-containing protein n=1 Tax=Paragonimus heterotremus TaxID=100268 RepID=A0A8J4SQP1_9TREM|nr:hypothetical protein PHET_02515 [Paragonimus heterotremus]